MKKLNKTIGFILAFVFVMSFLPVPANGLVPTDTTPPTVTITSSASDPTYTSPIPVTVTFSENVTGFTAEDITVGNASKSGFSGSGSVYTLKLTPVANGTVTVNVAANAAVDSANNGNTAADQFSIVYSSTVDYAVDGGYITFAPSTRTVTGFKGSPAAVVIPDEISGVAVTMLGQNSFSDCTSMTSVVIPDSVTMINQGVFSGCTGLTSITIPDSITDINQSTFLNCTELVNVVLPNGLKTIKDSAFNGCIKLTGIAFPDTLELIGDRAFKNCMGLTDIIIPEHVTEFEDYAFQNCSSLAAVYMKCNAPVYGVDVFSSTAAGITVYYRSGSTGFSDTYAGCPTALWGQHTVTVSCGDHGTVSPETLNVYDGEKVTFTITPDAGFQISTLTFNNENVTADAEGKYLSPAIWAAAALAVTFEAEGTPTVTISTEAPDPTNASPIPVTITFSEAVTGFDVSDIGVTGGTAGNFNTTGAAAYTADIAPSGDGTVTVRVAANAAQNAASVGNRAAVLSVIYDATAPSLSNTEVDEITDSEASLNFTSSEAGTYYYLVYPAEESAPDAATIKAQSDGSAEAKGAGAAVSGANSVNVTGLSVTTDYKVYVVVEDAAGNLSAVKTVAFSTTIERIPLTSAVTSFESGKTYTIKDAEQLWRLSDLVWGGKPGTGATFELLNDITFGYWQDTDGDGVVDDGEIFDAPSGGEAYTSINYKTVGYGGYFFSGTFDGCGHTISGLYCKKDAPGYSNYAVFTTVDGGTVKNLRIADSYIKSDSETAGIVGELINGGTVEYCVVDSSVTISGRLSTGGIVGSCNASTIQYCYNMGRVSGTGSNVGGIVGNVADSGSLIQCCRNSGSVSGSYSGTWSEVGGIAGRLSNYSGTTGNVLQNCCNTGSISALSTRVGGIVGSSRDKVENCYNAGTVTGSSSVGGIVGEMLATYGGVTTGCYYDSSICTVGGINGADASGSAEDKTTAQMTSGAVFSGWDTAVWSFLAGSYPKLTALISTDETAPTLESAQMLNRTSVKVTLSEDCRLLTKANDGGFTVTETGGTAVYAVTATAQGDNPREVVLTVEDMFASGGKGVTVTYTRGTNGTIEDLAGNALGSDAVGVAAAAWETTSPTMVSAKYVSDTQITVTLSEDCFNLTNPNDGGFTVTETGGTAAYAVTSTVGVSNNKITLTVTDMSASGAKGITVTYTKGGKGIVTDLMGNAMETDGTGVPVAAWNTGTPEVDGVSNGKAYNTDVAATFSEGTATLKKDGGSANTYLSGTAITAEGDYILTVTNAAGSTVISFTIDKTAPVLSGASLISVTSASAEFEFTSDGDVSYYCLILPKEEAAPDKDAVRAAGPGANWAGDTSVGTNRVNVGGLIAETDFTAYLILEDAAGNRSAMSAIELTTEDTVIPLDDSVTTLQSGVTYTIDSADQLNRLGYLVQLEQSGAGSTFLLTEDIVFGYWQDKDSDGVVDDGEIFNAESGGSAFTAINYTVIGKLLKGFSGTFDGRGHTVGGLYTSEENVSANLALSALIGYVDGGIVRNVGVKESYLGGYKYPAGIVGHLNNGTVENCYTDKSVSIVGSGVDIGGVVGSCESSVITRCYNRGSVSGEGSVTHLGGVVGQIIGENSIVRCCYNTGTVYAEDNRHGTGGIAGVLGTGSGNRIENCYNTGSVTGDKDMFGGIAGSSYGIILNCYNVGEVGGTSYRGNIVGSKFYLDSCVTTGCYYDSDVCAAVGGIEGSDTAGGAEGKTTAWLQSGAAFSGWDTDIWIFEAGSYPKLVGFPAFEHIAPTIESAALTSDTEITVTLSEDCRYLTKAGDGGFTVTEKDGTKTYAVTATAKGIDAKHVILTVADMAASGAKGITVTYKKGTNGTIADLSYNPLQTDDTGITIDAWDTTGPEVGGVTDGTAYNISVIPTFTEGTATLKKDSDTAKTFTSGAVISEDGSYVLTVTDVAGNSTVISFTIDTTAPEVAGLTDGASYNDAVTPTFTEGTATLKKYGGTANAFISGTAITEEGSYVLTVTDAAGNETVINFTIDMTAPTLSNTSADTETGTGATLHFNSGEACTYYYIVLPSDGTAPDAEAVRAQGYGPESLGSGDAALGDNSIVMTGLLAGRDYKVYVIVADAAGNTSDVKSAAFATTNDIVALEASVTSLESGRTYTIASAEQLNHLAELVDGGQTGEGATFVLTSDIRFGYWQDKDSDGVADDGEIYNAKSGGDAYTATNYDMIGYMDAEWNCCCFSGTFDGRGHTVSGLYNNTSDPYAYYSTLFGRVDGGTVRNVGVKESYIQGGISVSAVVGDCYRSTVENCWTEKSVSIVGFCDSIGGIVGYCESSIVQYCYNEGGISGTGEASDIGGVIGFVNYIEGEKSVVQCCFNTGNVSGETGYSGAVNIGGVVGYLYDEGSGNLLQNCYNTGSVSCSGGYIGGVVGENLGITQYCYNAGTVGGSDYTGGIAGDNLNTVTGCYYDSRICAPGGINGSDVVGSAEGKDTAWMTSGSAYTDWSINFWRFESGAYPKLVGALVFDVTPPTVAISSKSQDPTNDSPISVTITFSEDVTDFTADDITVGNGTKGTLSGSGKDYTIDITPDADGAVTVDIAADAATDAAGNGNTAAEQLSVTYDGTAPSAPDVTSSAAATNDATPTWTWTAGGGGNGTFRYKLDDSDLTSGAAESTAASFTPASALGDGSHTLYVQERDAAGNWSSIGRYTVTVDSAAPTVALTSTSPDPTNSAITVSVTFSEDVTGFTADDITVSNGTKGTLTGSGKSYSITITPSADGRVTVDIVANAATDTAGNGNTAATQLVRVYDNTSPAVALTTTASDPTNSSPIGVTITFSEDVTGLTADDISVKNGTKGVLSGSGRIYSISVTPSADGEVTIDLAADAAVDAAGNGNTAAGQLSVTYDTAAPTAPDVTSSAAATNDATPTWTWTAGGGGNGTFRYKLDDSDLTSGSTATESSSFTPAAALADGSHTLYVQERDAAGNWSSSGSYAVTIDTTAPAAPDVISSAAATNDATPTWTWTAGGGGNGTFRYKLDDSDLTSGATVTTAASFTPASALDDGSHTLYVQERDAVGNWSSSGSYAVTVDTTAPSAPVVTSSAAATNDATPTWTWTAGGGGNGTFRYKLDDSDLTSGATETTASAFTPASALGDGTHTLYVQERDAVGNWSSSGRYAVTVDTAAPTAPDVTSSAAATNDTTPAWTWTAGGGGNGTFRYKLDDSDLTSGAAETTVASFTPAAALDDGTYTLYVQERDAAGNWSSSGRYAVTVDTAAPSAPDVTCSAAATNDATPTWTWTAGGGGNGTFRYKLDDSDLTSGATETTASAFTPASALGDGTHTLYVQERDAVGNWSSSGSYAVTVDTAAPTAPDVTSSAAATNDATPTWTWTAGGGGNGTFRYKLDDSDLTSGATETTASAFTPASALGDGTHTLYVQERDAVGNWSSSGRYAVTVDTAAPVAPDVTSSAAATNDTTPAWTWTAGGGGNGTFRYKLDDSDLTSGATETESASFTPAAALDDGTYTLYVQERDAAGNWSSSGRYAVTVDTAAPTVGGTGTIAVADITWLSARLSWGAASDTSTAQENLLYMVVRSNSNNISTPADAAANGTRVTEWTANLTSAAVTGLTESTNYYFNIITKDAAGNETVYTAVSVTTTLQPRTDPSATDGIVYVNGVQQNAGTLTTTARNGQTVSALTVDADKLDRLLEENGQNAVVTIPIKTGADVAEVILNGRTVENLAQKGAVLELQTERATFTLPASEIDIDAIAKQFGTNVSPADITVTISISKMSGEMAAVIENAEEDGGFRFVVPAVEFTITCSYGGKTVETDSFSAYVERTIAIPDGVDPEKITTGVVVDPDGTVHHVPTKIVVINGQYYAVINSLTNSVYSVIWNPVEFSDAATHWAKDAINDMGSRLIVSGVGNGSYNPERAITRAEFAAIIVRALGLKPGSGTCGFSDVNATDWYNGYIKTASEYGVITGYSDGTFRPNEKITREQAMVMIARAMKITGLDTALTAAEIDALLSGYADGASASNYAKDSIAACLGAEIITGRNGNMIAPKDYITRAEVAVIIQRLLKKSDLI